MSVQRGKATVAGLLLLLCIVVACNRAEMSEVRVCLSKALQPIECGRGVRNSCPYVGLRIPAAR